MNGPPTPGLSSKPPGLTRNDYTVACICPMGVELAPVEALLDEIHPHVPLESNPRFGRIEVVAYTLGRIGGYNIVVAAMSRVGNNAAASVTTQLHSDFPFVEFCFLVGVGGGIPGNSDDEDVRLGDVVVSQPTGLSGGVIQYDLGKRTTYGGFERTGTSARPPAILSANVERLKSLHRREGSRIPHFLDQMLEKFPKMTQDYTRPAISDDHLFNTAYPHQGGLTCDDCHSSQLVVRCKRTSPGPRVHYGIVGSANAVIKDSYTRDALKRDLGIICVEMEAAGLMDTFPGLVIRGICDYADSHKNKKWQPYAAAVAAAYMKELLLIIPPHEIAEQQEKWMDDRVHTLIFTLLRFERMGSRQEEVAETYDQTFKWILHGDLHAINTNNEGQAEDLNALQQVTRTEFISWLRSGSGIYWVSGKAGSGKSTLMKSIHEALETREHLSYWAGEYELFIGHFYFYDRGGPLEKSQVGLIRYLLFQIFNQYPYLMAEVFETQWDRLRRTCRALLARDSSLSEDLLPNFELSKTELLTALRAVMSKTVGKIRMCIFIDGLDEFEGTDREVIQLMTQLASMYAASSEWHKICVSSRPHTAFEVAFKKRPSLRMQDLTKEDIYHYVHSQLSSHDSLVENLDEEYVTRFDTIVGIVVEQARGVFLWVRLAVMSLLVGLDQFDWIHELEERVKVLPPEFDSFYDRMLRMIDSGYRQQAARILRIMLDAPNPPHPLILSFLENGNDEIHQYPKEAFSYSALNARGRHMEQRLKSRFGGLIEISDAANSRDDWTGPHALFFHQTVRDYFKRPEPWKILLDGITVSWCTTEQLHKTYLYCTQLGISMAMAELSGVPPEQLTAGDMKSPAATTNLITLTPSRVSKQQRKSRPSKRYIRYLSERRLKADEILGLDTEKRYKPIRRRNRPK